jgi:subtilisin-like proprotein convertase family protein
MKHHRRTGILLTSLLAFLLYQAGCEGPEDEPPSETAGAAGQLTAADNVSITTNIVTSTTGTVSQVGGDDWALWGASGVNSVNRKSPVQANTFSVTGGSVTQYLGTSTGLNYGWSGGTPTASGTTPNGIKSSDVLNLYRQTDTSETTIIVQAAVYRATGTLTATVGSAVSTPAVVTSPGNAGAVTSVQFVVAMQASAVKTFQLNWKASNVSSGGYVVLHAAMKTWTRLPSGRVVVGTPPSNQLVWTDGDTVPLTVGNVNAGVPLASVEYFDNTRSLGISTAAPTFPLNYIKPAAGTHTQIWARLKPRFGSTNITNNTTVPVYHLYDTKQDFTKDGPVYIPDATGVGVGFAFTLPGTGLTVADVRAQLDIVHTYESDLEATLISPGLSSVNLLWRNGNSSDNFTNTYFWDGASKSIADIDPPYNGAYRPNQPLSGFGGGPASGTWSVQIFDRVGSDEGYLTNMKIFVLPR